MHLLMISFDGLHSILRDLYVQMMKQQLAPMMGFAAAFAGLGMLFFISYRLWQSISRAEPIDVFALLRPFVLTLCIMNFDTIVLGTLNGVFSPFVEGTAQMLKNQNYNVRELQKQKDELYAQVEFQNMLTDAGFVENEEFESMIESFGWSEKDYSTMQKAFSITRYFSLDQIIMRATRRILEFLFDAASLVVDTIRTFFLIVLSLLGPIAFAISVFDGFQNTLVQWFSRYISVYLWLPVSDLLGSMLSQIQSMIIERDLYNTSNGLNIFASDGSSSVYVIFFVIGIVGYFCIPTVSGWIVQAGGMGSYNRNVNQTVNKAGNVAGAAAGAATGNVTGVLVKK